MKEDWKDIEGYAGYEVSSLGKIRSVDRYVASKNGSKRLLKGQPIPPIIRGEGDEVTYIAVLRKNGKQTHCSLRKLVASAFVDNPKNHKNVRNIDGDRHNNRADNLEWWGAENNEDDIITNIYGFTPFGKYKNGVLKKWYGRIEQVVDDGYTVEGVLKALEGEKITYYGYVWKYAD